MLKQLTGAWCLEPVMAPGSASQVAGTRLSYAHDVRPKGLPPGVQFVPGMSGAVCSSVGKEVRQMVDKVVYVADKVRGLGGSIEGVGCGGAAGRGATGVSGCHLPPLHLHEADTPCLIHRRKPPTCR
jgi:hypothetical protein